MKFTEWTTACALLLLAGCSTVSQTIENKGAHLSSTAEQALELIPEPVTVLPPPPAPTATRQQLFSVVVVKVPVSEVLFTIARDAGINFDIHPEVTGNITINAVDQTLTQILDRMSQQVSIRYSTHDDLVRVVPDSPYLKSYDVDYPNMSRSSESVISIATEVATTGGGAGEQGGGGGAGNVSSTEITNIANNDFWARLVDNVTAVLRGGDSGIGGGNDEGGGDSEDGDESDVADLTSIIANPEAGRLTVRATHQQHLEVQAFLDQTMEHVLRQVLIEATIVEVTLNDEYQAGVDWRQFAENGEGVGVNSTFLAGSLGQPPTLEINYTNFVDGALDVAATVRALDIFGNAKVLSSPRLMVLNNQTALLKVVDNRVYFTVDVDTDTNENTVTRTFETEIHTVPIGLVMSVTPQISANDTVTLNARPTISRILGFAQDPNPDLASAGVTSLIPEVRVREMESLLKIQSGNIGIIGGLMQDNVEARSQGIPGLSRLPAIGGLFSYKQDTSSKSELVVFIRPIVIRDASVGKDLLTYERYISR
ncbi:MAG: pilus (MSHA type) biogenesis protein MshL [Pseudomonadales bacterium]